MAQLGNLSIYLILVVSVWAGALALVGRRRGSPAMVEAALRLVYALAAITSLAMAVLIYGLIISDFSLTYVQHNSGRAMPLFYRITAVWAGMEGSMLTWVWGLTLVSAGALRQNRQRLAAMLPEVIAVLMTVVAFFGVLMTVHSNAFVPFLLEVPLTGRGLNPLLQNPYMVTHPPALLLGYVGLTIPFAFAMAALLSGRLDESWIRAARPWALWAWYFLSLGLVLGMLWAYEELGWGGYWGWDPVENAAFMPWLTTTAFLHSIIVQERRRSLKVWSLLLAIVSFVMTIFGTFMTRSGFIDSVHAFSRSNIGYVFLAFIALLLFGGGALIVLRRKQLDSEPLHGWLSREFMVLLSNWVFLVGSLLVMFLTVFPNISELFGPKISIAVPVFVKWMVPVGLLLLALTGVGPMMAWRHTSATTLRRQLLWPAIGALVAVVGLVLLGLRGTSPLLAWGLGALVLGTIAQELGRAARLRARANQTGLFGALLDQIADNRRRYGGYIVHIGVVAMCSGFAGEAFKSSKDVVLEKGQRSQIGRYEVRYDGLEITRDLQKTMIAGGISVFSGGKLLGVMQPARWVFFARPKDPTSEVSILRSLKEDLFIAIGGYSEGGQTASFKLVVNPLVNWVWIGFLVMTLGAFVSGIPGARRKAQAPRRQA